MYKDFYKLKALPFQLSPDPSFFYASPGHKRVLSYLQYGVHQGDGFIVVTGDIGTGKTTLIRTLLEELQKESSIVAAQLVSTQLDSDDLLRVVSAEFGLKYENIGKPALLRNLEKFFKELAKKGKRVLLIVDEAQNLPVNALEELRMLSNFQDGNRALFQSFLVGQGEFRKIIRINYLEQLRQRIIASYHLGPLNEDDVKVYIEHRLRTVGWKNDPLFTDEAYTEIYKNTDGVPRRINTLCDRVMLVGALQESHNITEELVRQVVNELNEELHGVTSNSMELDIEVSADDMGQLSPRRLADLEQRIAAIESIIERLRDVFSRETNNISTALFRKKKNK